MVDGKWIKGLSASLSASEAARIVLRGRLAAVAHHLPLALEQSDRDPEHVHQLRVATRRASAAVRIFAEVLPKKLVRRAKRVLRLLRRAAGDARDWDVFLARLAQTPVLTVAKTRPAADFLFGFGLGQRVPAQTVLVQVGTEERPELDELVQAFDDDDPDSTSSTTLAQLGEVVLPPLFGSVQSGLLAKPTTEEALHQLRIAGKRLRYAMEIFAECYQSPFQDQYYPLVEEMQSILGDIQDAAVARDRLANLQILFPLAHPAFSKRMQAGFLGLQSELQQQSQTAKRSFQSWTRRWKSTTKAQPIGTWMQHDSHKA